MRIAVIDLGTNTFNLLVAEVDDLGAYQILYNEKTPVRLGEGGINQGFIADAAFERGLLAIAAFKQITEKYEASEVLAFATSAVRNASNGLVFKQAVLDSTGIAIQIITGGKEAEYICNGVRDSLDLREEHSLIIDIGGGSTEFILVNEKGMLWKHSFEIGAARLLDRFMPSDPILPQERERIELYLEKELELLWQHVPYDSVYDLIGASGSFESLAEMVVLRFHAHESLIGKTEYSFDLRDCEIIHHELLTSDRAARLAMPGLLAMRVDMIVVSAILVELVLRKIGIERMRMSAYSLKEGVLREFIREKRI
ncbi:MAG: exopolyphosphatase [Bacteroidia bacterium]